MKATAWEFKFRLWISFAIICLGFAAPWRALQSDDSFGLRSTHTWGWLVGEVRPLGISSTTGFALVAVAAILVAAVAAVLRIWGTAYLGVGTVFNAEMKAGPLEQGQTAADYGSGQVLADGPYRYMRNPLYAGSFLTIVALAVLMPPSGAAVSLPLLFLFLLRLILGEEAFLAPRMGAPYAAYRRSVPRLLPSLWPRVPAAGRAPQWGPALIGEIFPIGVVISFAALSWSYNPILLSQAMLVSFGLSLVVRALILPRSSVPVA
jgi:protein-S-isoprenylcysteine O-methyltransferase Ste14